MSKVAPGGMPPEKKFQLNFTETILLENKQFVYDAPNCSNSLYLCLCPCFPFAQYQSRESTLTYKNSCVCCCMPWKAFVDGELAGKTSSPGCCDNGCMFCFCPCLACDGEIIMQYFHDASGTKKYTIRRDLFPCWVFAQYCGAAFGPCGER